MSVVLVLTCILTNSAFASIYDNSAQDLKTIGLFKGTETGFDLDRAPTRSEAAVMLVRLLGAEGTAQSQYTAGTIKHPFTDVPDWAAPHVAWLYQNKLANGISSTLFGANDTCNAQMYCTFVLRALGYSDAPGGDFTYADSLIFSEDEVGIYSSYLYFSDTFLRDHAVAISYEALSIDLKGTTTTLLEKLVSSGAVSQASAKPMLDKITAYHAYQDAYKAWAGIESLSTSATGSIEFTSQQYPEINTTVDFKDSTKIIVSKDTDQMEKVSTQTEGGSSEITRTWIKDGYLYTTDGSKKAKTALNRSESWVQVCNATLIGNVQPFRLYMANSIESSKTSAGTLFTVSLFDDYTITLLTQAGLDPKLYTNTALKNMELQILFGNDGSLSSVKISFVLDMTYTEDGSTLPMTCYFDKTETINATGNAVTITYPDFSGYVLE